MTRHPKPIPMLGAKAFDVRSADGLEAVFYDKHAALEYAAELKSIGTRGVTVEPAGVNAPGVRNPAPEGFAAGVIANHVRTAIVELKRAYHYATQFSGVRFREVAGSISQHAARAGEYAAYSGRPLEQWHTEHADELAVPSIAAAFDAQYQATVDLLATPEEALEDDATPNPPVLRKKWTDGTTIVIESGPYGYSGWLENAMGNRLPISFGRKPTNAREALDLAKNFLRGVHGRRNPARWPSSEVQSLLFDTEHWTVAAAKRWAKDNGYRYGDVETTEQYHHLRQFDPIRGRPCRTMTFEEDARGTIKARVCSA